MRRVLATLMAMVAALGACGQAGPSGGQSPSGAATGSAETQSPAMSAAATPSPSPSPRAASPTGAIAFIRSIETPTGDDQNDVYLVKAGGGEVTRLTNDPGLERELYWLVDGSRLAYTWQVPGPEGGWGTYHQELASISADGTDRRDLGPVQTTYASPAFSPDRRSIVFSGDGTEDGSSGLVLLDLVDGTRRQLTTHGEGDAIWAPDGTMILARLPIGVVIVDARTGDELMRIADPDAAWLYGWTADGLSVIYHSCGDDLDKDECSAAPPLAADLDGSNVRRYTGSLPPGITDTTLLSPDGRWVASWTDGRLLVAPASGGTAVQVATGGPAAWSPDSEWLAFSGLVAEPTASGEAPTFGLFVVHRDGGEPTQLTEGPYDRYPAWRPD